MQSGDGITPAVLAVGVLDRHILHAIDWPQEALAT